MGSVSCANSPRPIPLPQGIKAAFDYPWLRRLLGRSHPAAVRNEIANRFLRGSGIEVGALNWPQPLPPQASARYVDYQTAAQLHSSYGGDEKVVSIQPPDIISDLETLSAIDDRSVDFVIANHVLEHVENPLRALVSVSRVLAQGGIAFIALPDKRYTFDRDRPLTSLSHVVRDYEQGPDWSRRAHYLDWALNVDHVGNFEAHAGELERARANIHFHVWDPPAMREMFEYACSFGLVIEQARQNRAETIWILRRA